MPSSSRTSDHYNGLYDTFYATKAGFIIPTITGVTSFVSSVTVIYFVLRSQSKLSTTYHRIMCFMSFWDIIASAAISFTTLPMPNNDTYPFAGKRLGNMTTCEAQAFCIFLGGCLTISGNIALNIYYLCCIRYKMDEERIKKVVGSIMFVCSLVISVPLSAMFLIYGGVNSTPLNSFCFWGPKNLEGCSGSDEIECQDSGISTRTLLLCMNAGLLVAIGIIFVSMVLIIFSNQNTGGERENLEEQSQNDQKSSSSKHSVEVGEENTCSKTAVSSWYKQDSLFTPCNRLSEAIFYVGAFCSTWIPVLLSFVFFESRLIQILKCILHPLQGFFNALIFFYHKIQNIRRSNENLTFYEALSVLRKTPSQVPEIFLSGMGLVSGTMNNRSNHVSLSLANASAQEEEQSESGGALSLDTPNTPSPSLDLSNAMSSTGVRSFGHDITHKSYYGGCTTSWSHRPKQDEDLSEDDDVGDDEELSSVKDTSLMFEVWLDDSLEAIVEEE